MIHNLVRTGNPVIDEIIKSRSKYRRHLAIAHLLIFCLVGGWSAFELISNDNTDNDILVTTPLHTIHHEPIPLIEDLQNMSVSSTGVDPSSIPGYSQNTSNVGDNLTKTDSQVADTSGNGLDTLYIVAAWNQMSRQDILYDMTLQCGIKFTFAFPPHNRQYEQQITIDNGHRTVLSVLNEICDPLGLAFSRVDARNVALYRDISKRQHNESGQ